MRDLIIRPGDTINLGRQGENIAEQVQFDVAGWSDLYGAGTYSLRLLRPGESIPYEAEVSTSGERVMWNVTETDTAIRGTGEAQLILTVGDIVAKTQIYHTMITPSIGADPEPPDPAQDWFDQIKGFADDAEESASDAEAWAVGERGGQAVPQSDETYHNNAKFYADQADTAKQSAEYFEGRAAMIADYAYNVQLSVERTAQDVLLYKGAPLVAATAAAMTDHNRVYVYVGSETGYTAGNWYYWSGSAWTSGGVYNAIALQTDKTLSVSDEAADGKVVGDAAGYFPVELAQLTRVNLCIQSDLTLISNGVKMQTVEVVRQASWDHLAAIAGERVAAITFLTGSISGMSSGASVSSLLAAGETGRRIIGEGQAARLDIPTDCTVIAVTVTSNNVDITPTQVAGISEIGLGRYAIPVQFDGKLEEAGKAAEANVTGQALEYLDGGELDYPLSFQSKCYVAYATGIVTDNGNFHCTQLLRLPLSAFRIRTNCVASGNAGYAFYDTNGAYVSGAALPSSGETEIMVPASARYVRLSSRPSYESGTARYVRVTEQRTVPNSGYKIVMLGDSIIGNRDDETSIPALVAKMTGAACYNCAFSGSNMGTDTVAPVDVLKLPFRGFKVIESIVTNDYQDMLDTLPIITQDSAYANYPAHVQTLQGMDWNSVDLITMSYGTNDWGTSVTLEDNQQNRYDTDTFGGAWRTALEMLWGKHPQIKVLICGPIWRGGTISQGSLNSDSDTSTKNGKYLIEFSNKEAAIATEYHVPFLEMYNETCFNKYTWKTYFPTNASNAVHPGPAGRYVMAKRYAHMIRSI